MPIQSKLTNLTGGFEHIRDRLRNYAEKPSDDELSELIAPNHLYDFDVEEVELIDKLRRDIRDARYAVDPIEKWSYILGDHLSYGNTKIEDSVAIFNMGAATDCVNLESKFCQVGPDECYAVQSEKEFPCIDYRRRQEIIWNHLDGETWAKAFRRHYQRKETPVTDIRFSEAGDFETQHDVLRVNQIARELDDIVNVYTYSASSWLDWTDATHFTVNQSNTVGDFGDRTYSVVDDPETVSDDKGLWCPFDQTDGNIKCGDCRVCLEPDGPDVYIELETSTSGPGSAEQ